MAVAYLESESDPGVHRFEEGKPLIATVFTNKE